MNDKRYIKGLDGVRGIAALGVVGYHVAALGGYLDYNGIFDRTVGLGGCFVRLFFILSSFSLMLTYFTKFKRNEMDWEKFYKKRFIKLFPLFWIAMLVHAIINCAMGAKNSIWEFIGTGSMLFGLFPTHQESIAWAGWTMGLQMIFYLGFPAFLVLTKNRKRAWSLLALSFLLMMAYDRFYGIGVENSHINILRQAIYFAVGAVIFHYTDWLLQIDKKRQIMISLACLVIEIANFFLLKYINGDIIMMMSFSALIILQIIGLDFIMKWGLFVFLGKISFEIYLLHTIVYRLLSLGGIQEFIHSNLTGRPIYAFFVYYFVVVLCTILLSWIIKRLLGLLESLLIVKE